MLSVLQKLLVLCQKKYALFVFGLSFIIIQANMTIQRIKLTEFWIRWWRTFHDFHKVLKCKIHSGNKCIKFILEVDTVILKMKSSFICHLKCSCICNAMFTVLQVNLKCIDREKKLTDSFKVCHLHIRRL